VLAALLLCPELASATGVELSLARHKEAERIKNSVSESDIRTKMHYVNEDIMNVDLSKADIIWLSSLMFPHTLILRICDKFDAELQEGCYIVSSRRLTASKRLKFIKTKKIIMSWNTEHVVYCYVAMEKSDDHPEISSKSEGKLSDEEKDHRMDITSRLGPEILDFFLLHERQGRPGRLLENDNDEEKHSPGGETLRIASGSNEARSDGKESMKGELLSLDFLEKEGTTLGDQSNSENHSQTYLNQASATPRSLQIFADLFAADT